MLSLARTWLLGAQRRSVVEGGREGGREGGGVESGWRWWWGGGGGGGGSGGSEEMEVDAVLV